MNAFDHKWDSMVVRDLVKHDKPADTVLPHTPYSDLGYKVMVHPDDGKPITFNWHFPRGTLSKRMSAMEVAIVLGPHLCGILPFLIEHPRCYREMASMIQWIMTRPQVISDRVVSWMKPLVRTTEYDIVRLSIGDKTHTTERPIRSLAY